MSVRLEQAAAAGNSRKLFQLIRASGRKKPSVSETIREANGDLIHNMQRRLGRWAEHFQQQFNCPPAIIPPTSNDHICVWAVDTSAPSETEISSEL